jgi:hypothetical protein
MNALTENLRSGTALINLDGFDGHTDECEGEVHDQDQFASGRVIQGVRIGFNGKTGVWSDASKQPLPSNLQLVIYDMLRVVQKWGHDNMPTEPPIILGPNEKWPDVEAMNKRCPESEWRMFFDKSIGPYQKQKVVYLWDPNTMNKYTWPASSNSAMACVSDLAEKIAMKRQFKKVQAVPLIKLASRLWSKKNNTQGPDLVVLHWIVKNANGTLLSLAESAALLVPPTAKEVTGDSINF